MGKNRKYQKYIFITLGVLKKAVKEEGSKYINISYYFIGPSKKRAKRKGVNR